MPEIENAEYEPSLHMVAAAKAIQTGNMRQLNVAWTHLTHYERARLQLAFDELATKRGYHHYPSLEQMLITYSTRLVLKWAALAVAAVVAVIALFVVDWA